MMDKKTILVVAICMLALVSLQFVVNKVWPPAPKKVSPAAATNVVVTATTVTNAPPQVEAPQPPPAVELPRPPEQIVELRNEFVRVEFTSWGGGIRTVELLKHKANGGPDRVILNAGAPVPALALVGDEATIFAIEQPAANTVLMTARAASGAAVTKRIALGPDYSLTGAIETTGAPDVQVVVGTAGTLNVAEQNSYLALDWYTAGKARYHNLGDVRKREKKGQKRETIPADWAAVKNQFFTMVLTPATNATATAVTVATVELPKVAGWPEKETRHGVVATVELPVRDGRAEFSLYAGPKEYGRLEKLGRGQSELMQFGDTVFTLWGSISVLLLAAMNRAHALIPSYGIAIVLITVAIKIIFWPVQAQSIKSMKAMQKFQPHMQKLREKYKDDTQKMNAEMMKLYKEHKINPFAGCLPMLVQMPVLIGFYRMLSNSVELRGESFLWIRDLSQPDTVFHVIGFPINPLPLAMTAASFWQMKLTPQAGDTQQQKMMMFMPVVMLFFFYNISSGLVLYWTVQQVLSVAQQWWSMRQPDAPTGKTK